MSPLFRYRTSRDRRRYRAGGVIVVAGMALLLGTTDYLDAQSPVQNPVPITGLPAATLPLTGNEIVPLVQNGETANAPASAFGSVISVFGRKGAVIAQAGDYSFSEINGTATPAQLPVATTSTLGVISPDGSTITETVSGTISTVTSTLSQLGVSKPDGSTIKVSSGVLSLPSIANDTILANVSGTTSTPSATTGGALSVALCQPQILSYSTGSGTYDTPTCNGVLPNNIWVRMIGGGGGGGGGNNGSAGNTGGNTTFGASLTADGGGGSSTGAGAGGSTSGGDVSVSGAGGIAGPASINATVGAPGGAGAASPFGGGGATAYNGVGSNALAFGTGGGGGGCGSSASDQAGAGGAAGGYLEKFLTSVTSTYSYAVGGGGSGASGGSNCSAGGNGAGGLIIVIARWQ